MAYLPIPRRTRSAGGTHSRGHAQLCYTFARRTLTDQNTHGARARGQGTHESAQNWSISRRLRERKGTASQRTATACLPDTQKGKEQQPCQRTATACLPDTQNPPRVHVASRATYMVSQSVVLWKRGMGDEHHPVLFFSARLVVQRNPTLHAATHTRWQVSSEGAALVIGVCSQCTKCEVWHGMAAVCKSAPLARHGKRPRQLSVATSSYPSYAHGATRARSPTGTVLPSSRSSSTLRSGTYAR